LKQDVDEKRLSGSRCEALKAKEYMLTARGMPWWLFKASFYLRDNREKGSQGDFGR